jgi:hypothetical protein
LNFLSRLVSHLVASYVLLRLQTTQGGGVSLSNERWCISTALCHEAKLQRKHQQMQMNEKMIAMVELMLKRQDDK